MLRAIAFGIAVGAAVQAWRNVPPDGPLSSASAVVLVILGIVCAYLGGLWRGRGRGSATAVAVASAEATAVATNTVNVAVLVPQTGQAVQQSSGGVRVPSDAAPWFGPSRPQIEAGDLDGMDLADLIDVADVEADPS